MGADSEEVLNLEQYKQLPTQNKKRTCTNVFCLIVGLVFSITLIVISTVLFQKSTFYSLLLPTDSSGMLCGYDYPDHPYLFFPSPPLIEPRVCLSQCPTQGDTVTSCITNSMVPSCVVSPLSSATNTLVQRTLYGDFCRPVDSLLTELLKKAGNMLPRIQFFQSLNAVLPTIIAVSIFTVLFFILVQFIGRFMDYIIIPTSISLSVFAAILVKVFSTEDTSLMGQVGLNKFYSIQLTAVKEAIFIGFIVVAVLILLAVFKNCYSIRLHSIFLKAAGRVVAWRKRTIIYILVYFLILVLFIGLVAFQFVGFWANGRKIFLPAEFIYYQIEGFKFSTGVAVILIIQLVWGISFIKQSFNFCLSGNTIQWYFEQSLANRDQYCSPLCFPLCLHISKHFGSVIACSFMTVFITPLDYLFDIVKPTQKDNCYASCFKPVLGWFHYIGDLVRSDALSLVAVNGSAYWESSIYCQELTEKNCLSGYFHLSTRVFSISAHCLVVSFAIIYAFYFPKISSVLDLILIIAGSLLICTCFVTFHLDISQTLHILFLLNQKYQASCKTDLRPKPSEDEVYDSQSNLAMEVQAVYTDERISMS